MDPMDRLVRWMGLVAEFRERNKDGKERERGGGWWGRRMRKGIRRGIMIINTRALIQSKQTFLFFYFFRFL